MSPETPAPQFETHPTPEPHSRMRPSGTPLPPPYLLQDAKIGLPLAELKQGIMVGAEVHGRAGLPSDGAVEHPAKCGTIDDTGMDAEADDATGELIHEDEDPMGAQGGRFAPEQVDTPETILRVPRNVSQDGPAECCSGR